jgi:hypothetical protein
MNPVVLTGLDGSNPLGFLAALGALDVLAEQHGAATLAWRTGDWRAVVRAPHLESADDLVATLASDLAAWKEEPCLSLKYQEDAGAARSWDLKPRPEAFRSYLEALTQDAHAGRRRSLDFAAAFATETALDRNGKTKPNALHFTAGNQEFLKTAGELIDGVTSDDLREALFGPWRYERALKVFGWDCTDARAYALRASDPSKDKKHGIPGADWLAFRGLRFIRVAPRGTHIVTTGCAGGWKDGSFQWPLWDVPLTKRTVHVTLQSPRLRQMSEADRRARGISVVFFSSIRRSDKGGYGSFAPATVV